MIFSKKIKCENNISKGIMQSITSFNHTYWDSSSMHEYNNEKNHFFYQRVIIYVETRKKSFNYDYNITDSLYYCNFNFIQYYVI